MNDLENTQNGGALMRKRKDYSKKLITPEMYQDVEHNQMMGPNGWLLFVACNSAIELAGNVKKAYDEFLANHGSDGEVPLLGTPEIPITTVFPDTESCPRFNISVSGSDAYVFQNVHENLSGNTVNENLMQLFQTVWALKEHGANRICVITPYGAYTRQDKPSFMKREPTTAKMIADFLKTCGTRTHIVYHPHTYALYGCYGSSVRYSPLSGLNFFLQIFEKFKGADNAIVVSVDAGGAKFTVNYADKMNLPYAIANKFRSSGEKAEVLGVIGDFEGKKIAIITDDETITGTSILNTVTKLHTDYGIEEIYVGISHLKLKEKYFAKLLEAHEKYGLKELHVTDSIPQVEELLQYSFIKRHSLDRKIASTINHLHYNQSITDIFASSEREHWNQ
ncbi:MAG: ribose-phosphate pyrophosphokinase [bacterium]|nr:ribose-phosphate pyrophosphokinase [bacterium]